MDFIYKLSQAEEKLKLDKYYDSIKICEEMISYFDEEIDDKIHQFNNGIEYYLYLVDIDSEVKKMELDFKKLYQIYGTSLMLIGKNLDARKYLARALEYNPYDSDTRFKYTETYRLNNELDEYYEKSKEALKYCYRSVDFQRFYRNISEYYFRYENYTYALYLMLFADYVYEENHELLQAEFIRLYDCIGKKMEPTIDVVMDYMVNKDILTPAVAINKLYYIYSKIKDFDYNTAGLLLQVLYELSNDEMYLNMINEYKAKIEELSNKLKK